MIIRNETDDFNEEAFPRVLRLSKQSPGAKEGRLIIFFSTSHVPYTYVD